MNVSSRRASTSLRSSSTEHRSYGASSGRQSSYDDAKSLKQQLLVANKILTAHELRAVESENQLLGIAAQLKRVNDARTVAVQEAAKAKEELELYKVQLDHAHQEIRRAQRIIDEVDEERYEAEKTASEARTMARRYQRELLMIKAMEEGRKLGLREGIEQGRALALRDSGEYDDVNEEDYANDFFDYTDNDVDYRRRSRSLLIASNEDIVIHPPRSSTPEAPPAPAPAPAPPPPPVPIPVPPPEQIQPIPETRPLSFRSASPSVYHQSISIPPDGYIPTVDADGFVRIPPPHELARPPPTPERTSSPQLPQVTPEEPRHSSRSHRRRQSGASFASTSTFSNAAGPSGRHAPLSAIIEVQSPYASPVPQPEDGHTLRHRPSEFTQALPPRLALITRIIPSKKAEGAHNQLTAFTNLPLLVPTPLEIFALPAQLRKIAAGAPPHPAPLI
ncbi:hypothetical protein C0991_000791 [Blastosporella zonata]|nr:hypothetical protein C0991_000791 [Blastosporella zonata]